MSAPINFWGLDGERRLLVTVGKSPQLREVVVTRKQAVEIIAALARDLGEPE